MVAIKNILFFAATAVTALTIEKRTIQQILNDITTIDNDVKQITSQTNAYNGGVSTALNIQQTEQTLESDLKQANKDTQATPQASSADSKKVINAVNNLVPDLEDALNAIVNKKANFAADGLTGVVQDDLNTLKNLTDTFANSLISIASSDTKSQGTSLKNRIDADFQKAINAYAS